MIAPLEAHIEPEPPSAPELSSVDGVVNAMYESISFSDGEKPQWSVFKSLFEPGARLARVGQGTEVEPGDVQSFCDRVASLMDEGKLAGFCERELSRRTEIWSDIAQVFSTYERLSADHEPVRGINAIQMYNDGRRWWILSMSWHDENETTPLPSRYLPRSS